MELDKIFYYQNKSLKAKDLFKFFRQESDEKTIPTFPEELATNFYNRSFLETEQYICLEQDKSIQVFISWLWLDTPEDGLKMQGSWSVPLQSSQRDNLFITPLCISKEYQRKINLRFFIHKALPNYKTFSFARKSRLITIKNY
jgi:hypothetical protein